MKDLTEELQKIATEISFYWSEYESKPDVSELDYISTCVNDLEDIIQGIDEVLFREYNNVEKEKNKNERRGT